MSAVDGERPRLLVVAGPNGAGKTTVTEQGLAHTWFAGCEYINPDLSARDELGAWNSPDAVMKAAQEAERRRETFRRMTVDRDWATLPGPCRASTSSPRFR